MARSRFKKRRDWEGISFNILVCSLFAFTPVKNALSTLVHRVGLPSQIMTLICYAVLVVFVFVALPVIARRMPWREFLAFALAMLLILISWCFNSDGRADAYFKELLFDFFSKGMLAYFLCRCIIDFEKVYRCFVVSAYAIVVSQAFLLIWGESLWDANGSLFYSQSFAYQTLPAGIIFANHLLKKFNWQSLVALIASVGIIFASGSRGPLLVVGAFLAMKLFLDTAKKPIRTVSLAVFSSLLLFSNQLYLWLLGPLATIFESLGLSTRNLYLLANNEFFLSAGRDEITRVAMDGIESHSLLGLGIGNDRVFIASELNKSLDIASGYYPHNIVLEFLLQYGIPLGITLLTILVLLIVVSYRKGREWSGARDVLVIMLACGLFSLAGSGSYLTNPPFFMFLGICVNIVKRKKQKGDLC